jgi:hypothetical protein
VIHDLKHVGVKVHHGSIKKNFIWTKKLIMWEGMCGEWLVALQTPNTTEIKIYK